MPRYPTLPVISSNPLSVVLLVRDATVDHGAVVASWLAFLSARNLPGFEILVAEARCAAGTLPADERVRLVPHAGPRGDGAALRAAFAEARHPLLAYSASHPDYRPEFLGQMLDREFVPEEPPETPGPPDRDIDHLHLMSGYRAGVKVPTPLRMLGAVWRFFCWVVFSYPPAPLPGWLGWRRHLGALGARIFFGVPYRDVCCPFRLLRREILARIPIQSEGSFAHVEILAKATFLGCMLAEEMPLDVRPRPDDEGPWWQEARHLFQHPDFGPAVLPTPAPPPEPPLISSTPH